MSAKLQKNSATWWLRCL